MILGIPRKLMKGALTLLVVAGCTLPEGVIEPGPGDEELELQATTLTGENLGGMNLGGVNLGGMNLGGMNLGGMNLGGTNTGGPNLGGMNMSGTNLGGNNLGGMNLAATNLGGMNLGGMNLGGMNLGGMNLAASNLGGSASTGTKKSGRSITGTRLGSSNLSGSDSGYNIHGRATPLNGMLYSGEDLWSPRTDQCIVMGIGSTAFAQLLAQQSANARIFGGARPASLGLRQHLRWTDRAQGLGSGRLGRQDLLHLRAGGAARHDLGRGGRFHQGDLPLAGATHPDHGDRRHRGQLPADSTLEVSTATYTGMMGTAAKFRAGSLREKEMMAGELALISATTNNESVLVDFSSWVRNASNASTVLGNVSTLPAPTYIESVYAAVENSDGTVAVMIASPTAGLSVPAGLARSSDELDEAWSSYVNGALKPMPRRCAGALFLKARRGQTPQAGKCDSGLAWTEASSLGAAYWSTVAGTTSPFNSYMRLTPAGGSYKKDSKTVISETYIHTWSSNFDLYSTTPVSATDAPCASGEDHNKAFDGKKTSSNFSKWCAHWTPNGRRPISIMYDFASSPRAVTSYSITSADDFPDRDPRSWVLEGCLNRCPLIGHDPDWIELHTASSQTFSSRYQTKTFNLSNSTAYSRYRLRITATNGEYLGTQPTQLAEIELHGGTTASAYLSGGMVSASDPGVGSEAMAKGFDSDTSSKWFVNDKKTPWLAYQFSSGAKRVVTSYRVGSGNDNYDRDPKSWVFEGSNDGSTWVALNTQSNQSFASRRMLKIYTISNTTAYNRYRFRVTANNGSVDFQMSELQLFGY